MGDEKVILKVLNPRGKVPKRAESSLSAPLDSLNGKKIGILNNTKTGGEMLMPYFKESLQKRFPDIEFRTWKVHFAQSPEIKEPKLKEMAEWSDGIIAFNGD